MRRIDVKSPVFYCISAHPLAAQQFGRVEVILSRATVLTTRIVKWTGDITVRVNIFVSSHWGKLCSSDSSFCNECDGAIQHRSHNQTFSQGHIVLVVSNCPMRQDETAGRRFRPGLSTDGCRS